MKKLLIILIVTFYSVMELSAQLSNREVIDSLRLELVRSKPDTNKAFLLQLLSFSYYKAKKTDSGFIYGWQALELSRKLSWKFGIAKAHNSIGCNYEGKRQNSIATKHFEVALKLYQELNDKKLIATTFVNLGVASPDNATRERFYRQAVQASEEAHDSVAYVTNLMRLGGHYDGNKNYRRSLECYLTALNITEQSGNKFLQANVLSSIAVVYSTISDNRKYLEYSLKSLHLAIESGKYNNLAVFYLNTGFAYYQTQQYPQALEHHIKALQIAEKRHDDVNILYQYDNIGLTYYKMSDFGNAILYFSKSLKLNQQLHDDNVWAWDYFGLGGTYLALAKGADSTQLMALCNGSKSKALVKARLYTDSSIVKFNKIKDVYEIVNVYKQMSEIEKLLGNYKSAYEYHTLYTARNDSNAIEENTKIITRAMMQYDVDKKETAAKFLQNEKDAQQIIIRNSILSCLALLMSFLVIVYRQRNKVKQEKHNVELEKSKVEQEKARSDKLLLNILPAEVADELKSTGTASAKHFENVTVLFTDFKNFTTVSEELSPQELVDELHTCFKGFDEIMAKYSIEKIKTIGDAYLAVSGLPQADENHAENVVRAALEIREFMHKRREKLGAKTFEIRIGINSGSVVAGIVGVKKFAYDIWGDTVNTAARMEQNSEPGKINISETTFALVKDKFTCEYRGEIDAKNKGKLAMYFVEQL